MKRGCYDTKNPDLKPRIFRVCLSDPHACNSIAAAAEKASDGDHIVVAPGIYVLGDRRSIKAGKKEKFPIYVPPNCQLIGSGADRCVIEGRGDREIADRPLNPYQSLI